ncbi:MAG: AAA domain-containing protein, partial [Wolinella sp.]
KEQQQAVEMIFSTPLSYTWGAPGTGKTKGVLFESLLFTITRGVRAFLLAPTNSALEQALRALMPKFDELGFERALVFRIGEPSASFLEQYPEVCDPLIFNKPQNVASLFGSGKEAREKKIEESLVIALTVDSFIKRFDSLPKSGEKHIFLDEAAFVPLIKALALCALHAPISMLGDHKQLPPVCEASEMDLEGEPLLNAWQYSALHMRDYFCDGVGIFSSHMPTFPRESMIPQSNLSYSHRYGENLTKILDKYIYKIGLRGLSEPTELYYVDSGAFVSAKKGAQANLNEADALAKVAQELARTQEDFGIITPFVKQRRAILERLPMLRDKDCVMTIHGSQGREFHTVLFSPVMLHYHLTNSLNLSALHALNVAISRSKKRVIIVCDYRFWMRQKGQFLSAILAQSSPLELGIAEDS